MTRQRIVVDASVMVKWIRSEQEESLDQANLILTDLQNEKVELYAPELAKYEVGNVLVKRKLDPNAAASSLETFYNIVVNFISETEELAKNSCAFARELNITYYDGCYLSLAQKIDAMVITENIKHLGKTKKVKVMPLSEYSANWNENVKS